mmetsp:Transcript_4801/g.12606  ORF Transcript_4801/g.12606 Transcript_4801/m.12606 type:complete len:151 (+) Transcript_4801:361-813(+)
MYLLKPYMLSAGAALLYVAYHLVRSPEEAIVRYASHFLENPSAWASGKVCSTVCGNSAAAHLAQVCGLALGCLGLVLVSSLSMGSDNRFAVGVCLLLAQMGFLGITQAAGFAPLSAGPQLNAITVVNLGTMFLGIALFVNRVIHAKPKRD